MEITKLNAQGAESYIEIDTFTFPGGEEHVRLDAAALYDAQKFVIKVRLKNSTDIMRLLLATDALKRATLNRVPLELEIPYFPYARQDRVCVEGEPLSAAVMASLINMQGYSKVTVWDVHSDVSPALVNNLFNIPQVAIITHCEALSSQLTAKQILLVSPDAGASKKTAKIAQVYGVDVIQGQKIRDPKNGAIIKTEIQGDVCGKRVLIVDDICDGGRTFIELAKRLKQEGAEEIMLFVTHGIFSNGLHVFEGLIDSIFTTDSFQDPDRLTGSISPSLNVISL